MHPLLERKFLYALDQVVVADDKHLNERIAKLRHYFVYLWDFLQFCLFLVCHEGLVQFSILLVSLLNEVLSDRGYFVL